MTVNLEEVFLALEVWKLGAMNSVNLVSAATELYEAECCCHLRSTELEVL